MSPVSCSPLFLRHLSGLSGACSSLHIRGIGSPCRFERKEAHPKLDQPFDEAMVLFDEVIEVFPLPKFAPVWHHPLRFELFERFWIRRVFIHGDDARHARMRRSKRFREEAFGCFPITPWTQEKFQRISLRIYRAIEVHPHFFHLDVRLIDAPRVVGHFKMGSAALLQFRCVALVPTVDGGVIDLETSLEHDLFQISIAQWITKVPPDAEQNDLGLEVTPFERGKGIHKIGSSRFSEYRRVYCILAIFATQPLFLSENSLGLLF